MSDPLDQDQQAQLYALLHCGNSGDTEFYIRFCRGAQRVLELGSGYGRIAVPLAVSGVEVTGIELHAGLLRMGEQLARLEGVSKACHFRVQDMRSFELSQSFDRIVIPYSGLFCLLSEEELMACLSCCRRHLAPGGKLAFDVYEADGFHGECVPSDMDAEQWEPVVGVDFEGRALMVYERSHWDKSSQRLDVYYEFRDTLGIRVYRSEIRQRYWLAAELSERLATAGFINTSVHGGFAGEPLTTDAEVVVFQAEVEAS